MISCIILNWNELEVSKDSLRRLLREPGASEVIIIDNGSTDGSKEYFRERAGTVIVPKDKTDSKEMKDVIFKKGNIKFKFIDWPENVGSSNGRNLAIKVAKGDYIFLLDGDILYVPGTIKEYKKVLDHFTDAYCVGQNSFEMLARLGHNGTMDIINADVTMSDDYEVSDWFPMAWTQYGLFRGSILREHPFVEIPPYNEAGYGFEDDWLHHEIKSLGYASLALDKPVYYHYAHSGIRELMKANLEHKLDERKKVFEKKWGKNNYWSNLIINVERTTRPNPNYPRVIKREE